MPMRVFLLLPVVLVCLAGSALPGARAQDKDDDPELVESVEVEADSPVEDVAAFATTLSGDELTRRGAGLADLLRRVPGARVRDFGGLGRFATVSFRASTAEQVRKQQGQHFSGRKRKADKFRIRKLGPGAPLCQFHRG